MLSINLMILPSVKICMVLNLMLKRRVKGQGSPLSPLVMDNNPALPHVSSIIHRHKYVEKDESLKTIIPPGSVFVSCRKNKTIGGMLIVKQKNNLY